MIGHNGTEVRIGGWIQTYSGKQIWPLDPREDEIQLTDIAHALANTARYGGHTLDFYSVAQHSVLVSLRCNPEHALTGLLHDASEAYLGDMPRPIKHGPGMEVYRKAEENLERMIANQYGLVYPFPEDVKAADAALLATEKRDLLRQMQNDMGEEEWLHGAPASDALPDRIVPMPPSVAEHYFLARLGGLTAPGRYI